MVVTAVQNKPYWPRSQLKHWQEHCPLFLPFVDRQTDRSLYVNIETKIVKYTYRRKGYKSNSLHTCL